MSGPPKDPHRTADTPVLSARGLYAGYGDMDVLHDVNFTVGRGEVVGIFGLNGAGKTTFVSALAGLIPIRRGSLHILGQDHTRSTTKARVLAGVSLVPQNRELFGPMTVRENLVLGAVARREPRAVVNERLDEVLDLFPEIAGFLGKRAGSLSGGQQQMVAIGRALMSVPELLLLDEPSTGLAPMIVETVFEAVGRLAERDKAIVIVEQDPELVAPLASLAYLMEVGRCSGPFDIADAVASIEEAYFGSLS